MKNIGNLKWKFTKHICVLIAIFFSFINCWGQIYTTGESAWQNVWSLNSGKFSFTEGVGLFSFGDETQGQVEGRFFTIDGTLGNTQLTIKPGQRIRIRIAGQSTNGRDGIQTNGVIGVSIKSNGTLFDGDSPGSRYDANSILKIEFVGGQNSARFTDGGGFSTANMPNFNNFKSGTTYDIEVISDREFNLVIGSNRNNVRSFAGSNSVEPRMLHIRNTGSNMDALFTQLEVTNIPINLTANGTEEFSITGVISNNNTTPNDVQKNGTGTIILSKNNTYTGTTTINAGSLMIGNGSNTGMFGSGNVVNNATLIFNRSNTLEVENVIQGTGTLIKNGSGTLILIGQNTYSGLTTVNSGTLKLNNPSGLTLPSSNNVMVNGGVFQISSDQQLSDLNLLNGTLTIDNGVTLIANNVTISNGVNIINNGTIIINGVMIDNRTIKNYGGTVRYSGASGNQTIISGTYNNLEFSGNATKVFEGVLNINGNVSILGGSLFLESQNLNRSSTGGSFAMAANTNLIIGSNFTFPANYSLYSLNVNSTTNYNGAEQTIANLNGNLYGNLILSNTGVKNLSMDVKVGGDMTLLNDVQVTVESGNSITVHGALNRLNQSEFIIESNANFIQSGSSNNNIGSVIVKRNALIKRLDMTLWSTPVANQNLFDFSPLTLPNRFFNYNETTNSWNTVLDVTNHIMSVGQGYAVRAPNNWSLTPSTFIGEMIGVPNSGDITQSISSNHPTARFNLIGNPYPSTLNLREFYNENNSMIENKFYVYEHTLGSPTPSGQTNYGVLTLGNVTANNVYIPASNSNNIGNETIFQNSESVLTGQGFFVKAVEGQSGNVFFKNSMRDKVQSVFFRNSNSNAAESNLFRLELTSPDGFFNQAVVGFYEFANDGLDMMDTKGVGAPLYTLANNEKYVVQGRAYPLNQSNVIPLGFIAGVEGIFKISVIQNQGIFLNQQHILLHDLVLGVYHNIQQSAYEFFTQIGTIDDRFQIVFVPTLSINHPALEQNKWSVFVQNDQIHIAAWQNQILDHIEVYDLNGRVLLTKSHVNLNRIVLSELIPSQSILIIQGTTSTGQVYTQKVIY